MAHCYRARAQERGDDLAVIDEDSTRTWAELDEHTNRLVHALWGSGIGPGDTFSAVIDNGVAYAEIMSAAGHGGQKVVPVNWHWSAEELAYVIEDSGSKGLIADERFLDVAVDAVSRLDSPPSVLVARAATAPAGWRAYDEFLASGDPSEPDGQCMGGPMFYTSGTTGFPKGVTRPGGPPDVAILELMGAGFSAGLDMDPADALVFLNGPGYHSAQWAYNFLPMVGGATLISRARFDASETLKVMAEYPVTHTHLVPTQFIRLLRLPDEERNAFDPSDLKVVWHGAAACPHDVKRQMIDWWGPVITEYYGGTEAGVISSATAEQWLQKPGTLGPISPMAQVRICDDDGHDVPTGTEGQIYFKGTTGDFEYHNAPEKTQSVKIEGGWATLGDLGYLDEDGWLFLSGRKIDMIISGGVNIYPAEIEGCLVEHPAVHDAAVFGIPNEEFGEEVKAAVELTAGHEPSDELAEALRQHVREHLAGYKVPRSIDFEDELPRHPTGKLYKRLLKDKYWP